MNDDFLKDLIGGLAANVKQVNILTGDHAQVNYNEAEKPIKQASKNETDVEAATKAALEYVGRLKEMVTPAWQEHYMDMFARIFSLPQVRVSIAEVGRQKGTTFNRNMVASFVHLALEEKGIFINTANASQMSERLEQSKDHSVKAALGLAPDDKELKDAVKHIIAESKKDI